MAGNRQIDISGVVLASLSGRELGFVLSKEYWGRGLMPETVRAVIRYLFDVEGFFPTYMPSEKILKLSFLTI